MKNMTTDEPNCFGELLSILNDEELLRLRRRFEIQKDWPMAEILSAEIEKREGLAKRAAQ